MQQLLPQHVVALEQLFPFAVSHGGAWHAPLTQVDLSPVHWTPHPPQLNGSSCSSTHLSSQHVSPPVHATVHAGAPLLEPLLLPDPVPLEPPLPPPLDDVLPPDDVPLPVDELLPLEPPELVPDEPLLDVLLPPLLLEPPLPSTDASGVALPSVSVAPPQRASRTTRPPRTMAENK